MQLNDNPVIDAKAAELAKVLAAAFGDTMWALYKRTALKTLIALAKEMPDGVMLLESDFSTPDVNAEEAAGMRP